MSFSIGSPYGLSLTHRTSVPSHHREAQPRGRTSRARPTAGSRPARRCRHARRPRCVRGGRGPEEAPLGGVERDAQRAAPSGGDRRARPAPATQAAARVASPRSVTVPLHAGVARRLQLADSVNARAARRGAVVSVSTPMPTRSQDSTRARPRRAVLTASVSTRSLPAPQASATGGALSTEHIVDPPPPSRYVGSGPPTSVSAPPPPSRRSPSRRRRRADRPRRRRSGCPVPGRRGGRCRAAPAARSCVIVSSPASPAKAAGAAEHDRRRRRRPRSPRCCGSIVTASAPSPAATSALPMAVVIALQRTACALIEDAAIARGHRRARVADAPLARTEPVDRDDVALARRAAVLRRGSPESSR